MKNLIDLHTHSKASDGSMEPAELVRYAFEKGLKAIALTDHDTIQGLPEAIKEGKSIGLEVVPGVEISANYTTEMHILGYFPENNYTMIDGILKELRGKREERNPRIVNKLNQMGFEITMEDVWKHSAGGVAGRPHIAKALFEKGYVESMREAFDRYLSQGKPAYFKKDKLTPEQCICEILKAGGVPVLAHPIYLSLDFPSLNELFGKLKAAGLVAIEAIYTENTEEQTKMLLQLAEMNGLLVTGGSDFHGSFKPEIEIGTGRGNLEVPYDLLDGLRKTQDITSAFVRALR